MDRIDMLLVLAALLAVALIIVGAHGLDAALAAPQPHVAAVVRR